MQQIYPTSHKQSVKFSQVKAALSIAVLSGMLAACGGGGGSSNATTSSTTSGTTGSTNANTTPTSNGNNTTTTTTVTTPPAVVTTPVTTPTTPTNTSVTTPASNEAQAAYQALNAKRSQCGFGSMEYSSELAKAASNHANYLNYVSAQTKNSFASHNEGAMTSNGVAVPYTDAKANPYYSGFAVQDRINTNTTLGANAQVVAYNANLVTENLSVMTTSTSSATLDSVATSQDMLSGLLAAPYHLRNLVNPKLTQIGASYLQTNWQDKGMQNFVSTLEMVSALPNTATATTNAQVLSYPCNDVTGTEYQLTDEAPNPMPNRDLGTNPIGQPIYLLAPSDKTIASVDATVMTGNTNVGKMNILTQGTDPNKQLNANEAFVLPDSPLKPATTYQVSYTLHYSTGETVQNSFSFTTRSL